MPKGRYRCRMMCCNHDRRGELLNDLYNIKKMSSFDIGRMLNVSNVHILTAMKSLGMKRRSRSEGIKEHWQKHPVKSKNKLKGISDEELFLTPIGELSKKYLVSSWTIKMNRGRKEDAACKFRGKIAG